ncbi:DIS3-like exonuclease 2 isoform X2 [Amaranthus tricolor]|uniref:DIS3-like exonuclease 2 isoform X2 n=1 Tax=Amaranthus tricolor TaxID=29722 RepID=UPI00258D8095|nr:DIS3-like exonuclease 2 isoform X2 [Amaranthus tricolor]
MMVVEQLQHQQQQQQQSACVRSEDLVDKKKRRVNRRSKQNSFVQGPENLGVHGHIQNGYEVFENGNMPNASSSKQHSPNSARTVAFYSFPTMNTDQQGANLDSSAKVIARSCPTLTYQDSAGLHDEGTFKPPYLLHGSNKQKYFDPHWSVDTVAEALQRGEVFQATLRINAHNRIEAYCTIEGIPIDVFINGIPRQNRAVEGDVVAVKVDPPLLWSKMKGSLGSGSCLSLVDDREPTICSGITHDSSKGKAVHSAESGEGCPHGENEVLDSIEKLYHAVVSSPSKRPTGRVIAIIEPSPRRGTVVGFLNAKCLLYNTEDCRKENRKNTISSPPSNCNYIQLIPTDLKLPKMIVPVGVLPTNIKRRLDDGDASIDRELVAARIQNWTEDNLLPQACVLHIFGKGGELEPRIKSILFENAICCYDFPAELLSCLPDDSWQVPTTELLYREDIRNLCVFTIDPSMATDLDDALSVERISNDVYRVGVHIADVSYFVQPGTPLDVEACDRSTSVYMLRSKLPMLPPLLSEKLGSVTPGVDRLAFSIFWNLSVSGDVLDRWVGRTVIKSCCKLSYEHAQDIIDGQIGVDSLDIETRGFPHLYGHFSWHDVFQSIRSLNEISKVLKDKRFLNGALRLDNAKVSFLLDEFGYPYDSVLCERKDSHFLVEEFMLLANSTAAEIISRAFPDRALLRRHPEPNIRKLREFEVFCSKHGLELDVSSSGSLNRSLEKMKEIFKEDSVVYEILVNYATRPMQLAKYFCTGDSMVPEDEWGHYALAVPLYTHFTSPLRRYPDIVVHRTLSAAIEAEQVYMKHQSTEDGLNQAGKFRCFTGIKFDALAFQSVKAQLEFSSSALKHGVPSKETLMVVASYCNQKKLASRYVKDAVDKLFMWVLLRNKEILVSDARVLGVGPRFMSIYVQKFAIEKRIYYDDVDGLKTEWLEATSTLILSYEHTTNNKINKRFQRRGSPGKLKPLEEVAVICSPFNIESDVEPAVFPLTVRVLTAVPVVLHAVGGEDGPCDIGVRLYINSYFT